MSHFGTICIVLVLQYGLFSHPIFQGGTATLVFSEEMPVSHISIDIHMLFRAPEHTKMRNTACGRTNNDCFYPYSMQTCCLCYYVYCSQVQCVAISK